MLPAAETAVAESVDLWNTDHPREKILVSGKDPFDYIEQIRSDYLAQKEVEKKKKVRLLLAGQRLNRV